MTAAGSCAGGARLSDCRWLLPAQWDSISLYQLGIIKHIPEPPGAAFDADKVDASAAAYGRLSVGDAYSESISRSAWSQSSMLRPWTPPRASYSSYARREILSRRAAPLGGIAS
jgi:hypothetical protein